MVIVKQRLLRELSKCIDRTRYSCIMKYYKNRELSFKVINYVEILEKLEFVRVSKKEIIDLTGDNNRIAIILDGKLLYEEGITYEKLIVASISEIINNTANATRVVFCGYDLRMTRIISYYVLVKLSVIKSNNIDMKQLRYLITYNVQDNSHIQRVYDKLKNENSLSDIQDICELTVTKYLKEHTDVYIANGYDVIPMYDNLIMVRPKIKFYRMDTDNEYVCCLNSIPKPLFIRDTGSIVLPYTDEAKEHEECYKVLTELNK